MEMQNVTSSKEIWSEWKRNNRKTRESTELNLPVQVDYYNLYVYTIHTLPCNLANRHKAKETSVHR